MSAVLSNEFDLVLKGIHDQPLEIRVVKQRTRNMLKLNQKTVFYGIESTTEGLFKNSGGSIYYFRTFLDV